MSVLIKAFLKCYRYKSPVVGTKTGEFSLILSSAAFLFFLIRLIWPAQLLKFIHRIIRSNREDIHPLVLEIYIILFLIGECAIYVFLSLGHQTIGTILIVILAIRIFEILTSNLYYLVLRPIVDRKTPHNEYRSFILSIFATIEVWLILSIFWYQSGAICPNFHNITDALYFSAVTFFTIGYGDFKPVGNSGHLLSILSMFSSASMLLVVLTRAISGLDRQKPNSNSDKC